MKIKKVLIVTSEFPPQPGGIGNHAYHLALYLSKLNYSITVIADQRDFDNNIEEQFDASLPFKVKRIRLRSFRFLMYLQRIVTTTQSMNAVDFVIATGKFSLWNVAFCTRLIKRRSLAIIHGTEVNLKSSVLKYITELSLNKYNSIVAVSNYTKQLVKNLKRDISVIPNGIDLKQWGATTSKAIHLKGYPIITTVGRVSTRKGQLQVIEMLPKLILKFPDIHYHCVGIKGEAEEFGTIAKKLNVEKHLTFHGVLLHEHLKEVLAASDSFVMLSQESLSGDVEGFGIAILEANALGIPAIGAIGCGIEDAIVDGTTGFLIDGNDADGFADSITTILQNEPLFKENALKWAHTHDWGLLINRYQMLIN